LKVIVIVSDTLRWDFLGCYGNKWIRTPNIDALAKRSIVFDKAYGGSFPTIPHRTDLFTGHYCFHARGWAPIPPEEETFPKLLTKAGYYTEMVTDTGHLLRGPLDILRNVTSMGFIDGFSHWEFVKAPPLPKPRENVKPPSSIDRFRFSKDPMRARDHYASLIERKDNEYRCAVTMSKAAEWLEKNRGRDKFLLYVDTFDPHEGWVPPDEYVDLYDPRYELRYDYLGYDPRYDYANYLSEAEIKHLRALYAGMVTLVDKWVGFLLDKINEHGLFEEAAVIFTSDHGFYHGEHGRIGKHNVLNPKDDWPLYEEVNHLPLIMSIPDMPKGERNDLLVQPVDIMATVLDLAEITIPEGLHGQSIMTALRGEKEQIREIAVSSGGLFFQYPIFEQPPHIKYQFALSSDPTYVGHSTITDREWALIHAAEGGHSELYNLMNDPKQNDNMIMENTEVARNLHKKFYDFLRDIGTNPEILRLREKLNL